MMGDLSLLGAVDLLPSVEKLEEMLLRQPQVECPIVHVFLPGIYMREMHAPAGTLLLGHEHKTHHTCLLLKGTLRFQNENGTHTDMEAPMIFEGKPGKKFALTLTDVVFCNLHATEETDVEKLEDMFVIKNAAWKARQAELTEQTKLLED